MKKFFSSTKMFILYWFAVLVNYVLWFFNIVPTYSVLFFIIFYSVLCAAAVFTDGIKVNKLGLILTEIQLVCSAIISLFIQSGGKSANSFGIIAGYANVIFCVPYIENANVENSLFFILSALLPIAAALIGEALFRYRTRRKAG